MSDELIPDSLCITIPKRGIPEISPDIPVFPNILKVGIPNYLQIHPSTPTYPQISSGIPNAKYPQISSGIPTHHEIPLSIPKNHQVSSTTTSISLLPQFMSQLDCFCFTSCFFFAIKIRFFPQIGPTLVFVPSRYENAQGRKKLSAPKTKNAKKSRSPLLAFWNVLFYFFARLGFCAFQPRPCKKKLTAPKTQQAPQK